MDSPHQSDFTSVSGLAKPLKLQQLEQAVNLEPYLDFVEDIFNTPISDDDTLSESDDNSETERHGPKGIYTSRDECREDKSHLYNFQDVGPDREWLRNVLLSDTDDDLTVDSSDISDDDERIQRDDQRIKDMLKEHVVKQKYRVRFREQPELRQYQYYGSGLLSSNDRFPEHNAAVCKELANQQIMIPPASDNMLSNKKRKSRPGETSMSSPGKTMKKVKIEQKDYDIYDTTEELDPWLDIKEESDGLSPGPFMNMRVAGSSGGKSRRKAGSVNNVEAMNARRKKLWVLIAKKEVGKTQRSRSSNHKEVLTACKRTAAMCMKVCRQKAMQSQKNMKETVWRMKRLTREMQAFWKRYDRVERETRKRMEKEAEEQRKMDTEFMEAKRQQRKLNFLITQTELYAHFMQRKLQSEYAAAPEDMANILGQLDENDRPARLAAIDDYDSEQMKAQAQFNVSQALNMDQARVQQFPIISADTDEIVPEEQPEMFQGVLKHYQIKGVSWLANLYDQGINGILADEMGLGKTVQSIAFLCYIAEKYSIWGPFLVISPASTLHNWQQEFARFVPPFKVIPYWGNPQERRILRQFWAQKNVHTEEASFHVVITSYQLVVADIKYFNRVKWQYLVLDEAQAIKSSSSVRWKSLLGFQCRNRLLLSGTPVQNSMAELWALLHFIMPTLFDNHEEFAEWFSKDIESHAENKGSIDEKHLSRLHMILKPFMLRRIKKDVENELSDKIELMVYCPLTTRQKLLYSALKKKIRIEDLLHSSSSSNQSSVTSSLMNLVMQFRKVCNHPELFERQEPRVAYHCKPIDFDLPQLIFDESLLQDFNPEAQCATCVKTLSPFSASNIHQNSIGDGHCRTFSFIRVLNITPSELAAVYQFGAPKIWEIEAARPEDSNHRMDLYLCKWKVKSHEGLPNLVFTTNASCLHHSFGTVELHSMAETLEHRIMRSSKVHIKVEHGTEDLMSINQQIVRNPNQQGPKLNQTRRIVLPEFKHIVRPVQVLRCQSLQLPSFLTYLPSRVDSRSRKLYCHSRRAANVLATSQACASHVLGPGVKKLHQFVPWGSPIEKAGLEGSIPPHGWSSILIPDKQSLISDAGKLSILDGMLRRLKSQGHRVLVYSQMTRMIDLLEEFMYYRKHTYMRLDGSSKISERRDMVADFQNREDIFVFLLSTRAGGLGINLTAADTVIFYDSDWNPTVDQQAMDRAHRLGQTKQVTVYRLICKDTIEERILQRAQEKSEIQRMVISGGSFKPDTLKPTEVVSLLLDDAEIERKYRQRQAERRGIEEKKQQITTQQPQQQPQPVEQNYVAVEEDIMEHSVSPSLMDEDSGGNLIVDVEGLAQPTTSVIPDTSPPSGQVHNTRPHYLHSSSRILSAVRGMCAQQRGTHGRSRGRPRGSRGRGRSDSKSSSQLPSNSLEISPTASPSASSSNVRRGPGRPRLKPSGPGHQGSRIRCNKKGSEMSCSAGSPGILSSIIPSTSSREIKEREFKSFNLFLQ